MKNLGKIVVLSVLIIVTFMLSSCLYPQGSPMGRMNDYYYSGDMEIVQERAMLYSACATNPDTDVWYDERQELSKALGSRDYGVNFSRAFDSLALAISSLEIPVVNMERQSGFLIARGGPISPTEKKAFRTAMVRDWGIINGYDVNSLDKPVRSQEGQRQLKSIGMMFQGQDYNRSINFQLFKLENDRTRIKARISSVYYPEEIRIFYERIWEAIDKQIFVDKNIDGENVKKRT